jgi:hypothetical protein
MSRARFHCGCGRRLRSAGETCWTCAGSSRPAPEPVEPAAPELRCGRCGALRSPTTSCWRCGVGVGLAIVERPGARP